MSQRSDDLPAKQRPVPAGSFRLGTVGGIDILVAHSWFLIIGVIAVLVGSGLQQNSPTLGASAYVVGVVFAVLLYASVLLHEISHAVAARSFEMQVNSINLHFLGGATEIEGEATSPWREFVVAIVGPLTSLVIGLLALWGASLFHDGLARYTVGALAFANLFVGGLNLVPGLPLDGGRVLQALVWAVTKKRSLGVVVAAWGGRVAAVLVACYPVLALAAGWTISITDYLFAFMVAAFLWAGATQALHVSTIRTKLPSIQARTLARPAIGVLATTPLAEAIRRAQEAHAGSVVVISGDGRPVGVVNESAVLSTPVERRPWVSCGDVARRTEDGLMLPADLSGEQLIRAMQQTPASEYVLMEPNGAIYGVLVTQDVDNAFRAA
ncbi:MAG: M50 family metallopeptidase [Nocardioidaceae bacterium]